MAEPLKKDPPKLNPFMEALKETYNVVGLSGCAAASLAFLNPTPLLLGLVAEAAYLLTVPDMSWYRRLLSLREKKLLAEHADQLREALKQQVLPNLSEQQATRFRRLEVARQQIEKDMPTEDSSWYVDILNKLDHLLGSFLSFALKEVQFRSYLWNLGGELRLKDPHPTPSKKNKNQNRERELDPGPPPDEDDWIQQLVKDIRSNFDSEMKSIGSQLDKPDCANEAIMRKRQDVLKRRSEYVGKMGEALVNLHQQMCLLEDTFGLINDEVRARSPQEVLSDVDDVVAQTNLMNEVLEQLAPFERQVA